MDLPKGLQGESNLENTTLGVDKMRVLLGWPFIVCFCPPLIRCWACVFRQNVAFCHRQCPAHQPRSHHRPTHCCSGEKSWSLAEHGTTSLQSFCSDWWGHQVGVISAINTENLILNVACCFFYSAYLKTISKVYGCTNIQGSGSATYWVSCFTMSSWKLCTCEYSLVYK